MLTVSFLLLIMLAVAKSNDFETACKDDYRDLNNTPIDVLKYCSNSLCIEKCCRAGEIISGMNKCINIEELFKIRHRFAYLKSKVNYSTDILSTTSRDEKTKTKFNFVLVHNNRDLSKCSSQPNTDADREYDISKNGSIRWQNSVSKKWIRIGKMKYCIDYKLFQKPDKKLDIKITIRQDNVNPEDANKIETFEIVAILISSFFLVLVLLVHCLLPELRNLTGLVLMAYTFSLLFAFVNKLILTFIKRKSVKGFCKIFCPVVYFAFLSSIFWLSAISFEVWWGLRSFRYTRASKSGAWLKFMWYGLYAWGSPLLITAIVTTLDNIVNLDLSVVPPFENCLMSGKSFDYYFKIPIGILIFINIVLFVMTVYNIWMVKHAVNKYQDSRSSKKQNNKFSTYAKLSLMMGLSWCLELLPSINKLWFYILTNSYNLFTGVAIFYWFICKKNILVQLCRKFNIQNDLTKKLDSDLSQHTKSTTRTTDVASSIINNTSKDQNQENMDRLKNFSKEESLIV